MSILGCSDDFDCPNNLVCFGSGEPWSPVENGTFCDCMHDEGWTLRSPTDQICLGLTNQAFYFLSIDSLLTVVCVVALARAACFVISYLPGSNKFNWVQKVTLGYTCLGLSSLIVWRTIHIAAITSPDSGVIDVSGVKKPETHYLQNVLIIVFCGISMMAYLNVSLVWMDVLSKSQKVFRTENCLEGFSTKRAVYGVQFLAVLLASVAAGIGSSVLAAVSFVVPFVVALFMYTRGRYVLSKLLKDSFGDEKVKPVKPGTIGYHDVAIRIERTSLVVILALLGILLGLLLFAVLYDPRSNTAPGKIAGAYIGRDVASFAALVGLLQILEYLLFFLKGPKRRGQKEVSVLGDRIVEGEEEPSSFQVSL